MGRWNVANCFSKVESGVYRCIHRQYAPMVFYIRILHPFPLFYTLTRYRAFVSSPRARARASPFFIPIKSHEASRRGREASAGYISSSRLLFLSYTHVHVVRARGSYATNIDTLELSLTGANGCTCATPGTAFSPFLPLLLHYLFRAAGS